MRKIIASFIAVTALLAAFSAFTSCGKSDSSDSNSLKGADFQSETGTLQPDPLATTQSATGEAATVSVTENGGEKSTETASTTGNTEEKQETTAATEADPLGGGAFTYDEYGAIVFKDSDNASDETLIAAAQMLFKSACNTEWEFKFGEPFEVDSEKFIQNDFGWKYHLVTTPGISSLADVEKEYNKVFSSKYPNELSETFIEKDGAVYALFGKRGKDIFYSASKITAVKSVSEDEIFFTVTSYYDGSDNDSSTPCTKENDFSAVIDENGTWHVGKFTLPY